MNLCDLLPFGYRVRADRPSILTLISDRSSRAVIAVFLLGCCIAASPLSAQTVLVDFGASPTANTFGLAGWNTVMHSPSNVYTSDGPAGLAADTDDEYADYQGVRGTARRFNDGECILVTWYNRSQDVIRFTARISFTDADQPDGGGELAVGTPCAASRIIAKPTPNSPPARVGAPCSTFVRPVCTKPIACTPW